MQDHAPLLAAVEEALGDPGGQGVCCLYCYETSLLQSPEWDRSHSQFIDECLQELDAELRQRGSQLVYRLGEVPGILQQLQDKYGISALYSHEESGNALTYARDIAVADWCRSQGIPWHEYPQHGVVRRLTIAMAGVPCGISA